MGIITKKIFIKKIKDIQKESGDHVILLLKHFRPLWRENGFELKDAKTLIEDNYDPDNLDKLYNAFKKSIRFSNKIFKNGLVVTQNSTLTMYKCDDNIYGAWFDHPCICGKEICKKYPSAIIKTLITKQNICNEKK